MDDSRCGQSYSRDRILVGDNQGFRSSDNFVGDGGKLVCNHGSYYPARNASLSEVPVICIR